MIAYVNTAMIRPPINADEGTKKTVKRYADDNGLKMAQAWVELVHAGIEAKGMEIDDAEHAD